MPGFNRTGPRGMGPMTGGGRGYCSPSSAAYAPIFPDRFSWGRGGRARGCLRLGYAWGRPGPSPARARWSESDDVPNDVAPRTLNREEEIEMLKKQANMVERELDAINKRMEALTAKDEPKDTV